MKKTFANIRTLAALLIASAALAACSNEDSGIISEQPAQEQGPQVYTLTLQAGKADNAQTRALKLETTGDLTAYWADGDVVTVTKGTTALGTLSVKAGSISTNGQTCTFTGELTGTVSTGDDLTLTYHPMASLSAFGSQNGQLVSAAACDMATASVKVAAVDDGTKTITVGTAEFETQTAVLKINLQDTGGSALNATSLTISAGGAEIFTLSPLVVVGTLYFALPSAATVAFDKGITTDELATLPITFSAKVGDDTYTATKTGYPFAAGKYYETTLKMARVRTLAEATSEDKGKIAGADGKIYDSTTAANAVTIGNAVAVIAYVGSDTGDATHTHGIAIGLENLDADNLMSWDDATSACSSKTAVSDCGGWTLPTEANWKTMFKANGGNEDQYTGLNTLITDKGGVGFDEDKGVWSSTKNSDDNVRYWTHVGGSVHWAAINPVPGEKGVSRACFAF